MPCGRPRSKASEHFANARHAVAQTMALGQDRFLLRCVEISSRSHAVLKPREGFECYADVRIRLKGGVHSALHRIAKKLPSCRTMTIDLPQTTFTRLGIMLIST